jgi:hypothetical protein
LLSGSTYSLLCSVCGWDSFADSSIILDRPTGLGGSCSVEVLY